MLGAEGVVKAAFRELHGADQVAQGRRLVAFRPEHLHRLVQRFGGIEFPWPCHIFRLL